MKHGFDPSGWFKKGRKMNLVGGSIYAKTTSRKQHNAFGSETIRQATITIQNVMTDVPAVTLHMVWLQPGITR
jgi:hypothetical protein